MATVCSISEFVIAPYPLLTNTWWVWDKTNKDVVLRTYNTGVPDYYNLSAGSVIDVVENAGTVYLISRLYNPNQPVIYFTLFSTSGSDQNKLVSAILVGYTLTVTMFSPATQETTVLQFQMQQYTTTSPATLITPCFNNFSLPPDTILNSFCDGFTLNEYKTNEDGEVELIQTFNSVTCGYSAPIPPFRISEELEIKYENRCFENPVYLVWKNKVGGWDYWLFEQRQISTITTESIGYFGVYYDDISEITNDVTEIGTTTGKITTLFADMLDNYEKIGIESIVDSPKVYVLNQDGTINRAVSVAKGSFVSIDTNDKMHTISIDLIEPNINTLTN